MSNQYILIHDIGTTGSKACLFSVDGELISTYYYRYDTFYPGPNMAEQRPQDWYEAVIISTRELLRKTKVEPQNIVAISWSGQMMGTIPVDRDGNLLQDKVMIWADSRAVEEAKYIIERIGGWENFYRITGAGQYIANYTIAKILWLKNNRPEIYKKTYKFLQAKDYITLRLTGAFVTDYTDAFNTGLLNIHRNEWSDELIDAIGIDRDKLPDLHESIDIAGYLRDEEARKMGLKPGIPVVVGSGDVTASATGAGVVKKGVSYIYIGSACWTGFFSDTPVLDTKTRISSHRHVIPGKYAPHNYTYSGAVCMDWLKDIMFSLEERELIRKGGNIYKFMEDIASKVPPGSQGLLFLPYMRGGGAPHYDPLVRGAFLGMTLAHRKEHFVRAVYEGIALNTRVIFEAFERLGEKINVIYIIGGGALSNTWRQIFADVLGKPVIYPKYVHEAGCLGSAVIGGIGAGVFKDFSVIEKFLKPQGVNEPNEQIHERYNEIYESFKETVEKLIPVYDDVISKIYHS